MTKLNEINYKYFSTKERLDLTIAALSRGHLEEAKKLRRTCPRYQYNIPDFEYTSKLNALPWIACRFSEIHNYYYFKILLCRANIAIYEDNPKYSGQADERIALFNESINKHVSHLRSIYKGLRDFVSVNISPPFNSPAPLIMLSKSLTTLIRIHTNDRTRSTSS